LISEKEKKYMFDMDERKIDALEDIGNSLELIASLLDTLLRSLRRNRIE